MPEGTARGSSLGFRGSRGPGGLEGLEGLGGLGGPRVLGGVLSVVELMKF